MKNCPECSAVLPDDKQKCDACGSSVSPERASTLKISKSEDDSPTKILETGNQKNKTPSDGGRFVAGTVLAKRYRILGILGKGGMGEVYKADDLELGQTVALKFLPESFSKNEAALARFRGEVRTARQVSHPNVCRVFDIGEIEGVYYLSMEYVDGDDLSQLLRRIGHFASDKAVEISRQICYGLQAIHNAGILHRDLKPANIIIDSQGKTRITDFGIAGLEKDVQGAESRIGTPAYMSPEQIAGKEVTTQSDIYSLGLLLYEIFTGEQAIGGGSVNEILKKQTSHTPPNISKFVATIDPVVENIINRCLEKKPENRPKTALQVAASLPGGNALEAAIAAGETPTPEMIAAVPKKGVLPLKLALFFSIFILAGFILSAVFQQYYKTYNFTPLEKSPEVLAERAKEIIKNAGYADAPVSARYRFLADNGFVSYVSNNRTIENPRERLRAGQPLAIYFIYRQSPNPLVPWRDWEISENDPPLTTSGMTNVSLDTRGRLTEFVRIQSQIIENSADKQTTDWAVLFNDAGLDITKFEVTEPNWTPPVSADSQTAWKGTLADFADIPIRIESAALNGKPVFFKIVPPWDKSAKEAQEVDGTFGKFRRTNSLILYFGILVGAILLVLPTLKVGSRDYKGGLKVAIVCFLGFSIAALIDANHFSTLEGETIVIYQIFSFGLYLAVLIGTTYIALEPFARRWWSELLISWNRLLAGDFRDPMVGRDILVGGVFGVCNSLILNFQNYFRETILGGGEQVNNRFFLEPLDGWTGTVSRLLEGLAFPVLFGLGYLFLLLMLFIIFRNKKTSIILFGIIVWLSTAIFAFQSGRWFAGIFALLTASLTTFVIARFGLFATITTIFYSALCNVYLLTFNKSSLLFPGTVIVFIFVFGLTIYGFFISTAKKSVFENAFRENTKI